MSMGATIPMRRETGVGNNRVVLTLSLFECGECTYLPYRPSSFVKSALDRIPVDRAVVITRTAIIPYDVHAKIIAADISASGACIALLPPNCPGY